MNVVFLDIDGVLNDFEQAWASAPDYRPEIRPRCVKAFNQIIRETEARIVLSSAWRYLIISQHMSLHGFQVFLRTHGVRGDLIAHTREDRGDEERWAQIADWLKEPRGKFGETIQVDRYAIIDDTGEAFGGRPGVRTDGAKGLTVANAKRVIRILNGSKVAA